MIFHPFFDFLDTLFQFLNKFQNIPFNREIKGGMKAEGRKRLLNLLFLVALPLGVNPQRNKARSEKNDSRRFGD